MRFEGFISDLSAHFVNITAEDAGREIRDWLKRITEFFRVDRTSLGLFSKKGDRLELAYEYHGQIIFGSCLSGFVTSIKKL